MVDRGTRTRPIYRAQYMRRYEWALRMEQLIRRGVYFEPKVADITEDDGRTTTVYELTIRGLTPDQVRKIFEDKLPSDNFDPSVLFRFNALNEQEKKAKEVLIDKQVASDIGQVVEKAALDAGWMDRLSGKTPLVNLDETGSKEENDGEIG